MLVWTDGGGSAVPNNSFVSFLQASPPARLQSVVPNQIPAVGIPSQAQHPSFADASVPDPEVPAMVVCGFLFSVLSQREVYFQISNLTRVSCIPIFLYQLEQLFDFLLLMEFLKLVF